MNKIKFSFLAIVTLLMLSMQTVAQTPIQLDITHKLGGASAYDNNHIATNDMNNSFRLKRMEYYISKISITHDGGMITDIPDHYILVNADMPVTEDLGAHTITSVESISFHVGVDTPANHEDPSLRANGHPLAHKSPSMHWGWTDGYRFAALEGMSGANFDHLFEIHSLGDPYYFQTTVSTSAVMKGGKLIIALHADYAEALKGIDVSSGPIEHGFSATNIKLLENFRDNVFKAGFTVGIDNVAQQNSGISIYPNPSADGNVSVRFSNLQQPADIKVIDIRGSIVNSIAKPKGQNLVDLHINGSGLYFITTKTPDGTTIAHKLLVQ